MLTSDGHAGKTYTLTGREALNYTQVAVKLSASLGKPVRYISLTLEQLKQSMREMGMPPWQVEALADLQAYYIDGPGGKFTSHVRDVPGRDPIQFFQFLQDYAAAFSPAAGKLRRMAMTTPIATANPATGFTHDEMKEFVRNHFEEFVNRKNIDIGDVNFALEFVDRGADVPRVRRPVLRGPSNMWATALQKFPDMHVTIEDIIAEGDKVVVRITCRASNPANAQSFSSRAL